MRDVKAEDTIYIAFTTRAFATGIPTVLAGTPVVSAYEDASLTQITAGITLGVDHDSIAGLNMLTVVATAANGYESGKDYQLVITTGTVDSVSVVGEVVGQFTIGRSAAAVDLANATDGLGALKTLIDTVNTDLSNGTDGLGALKTLLNAIAGYIDTEITTIITHLTDIKGTGFVKDTHSLIDILGDVTGLNGDAMRGTDGALTDKAGFSLSAAGILAIWHQALTAVVTAGSIGKLIKDEITAARMAVLTDWIDGGRLDLLLDAIPTTAMRGTDGALTDKAGFSLSAAGILAIWHQSLTAIVTAGSIGKLIKDEITAARMAVLTDWIDGGRLDALLDAIKAVTDQQGSTIIEFTVDTVTNTHTPTITEFQADDITEATASHYNGRLILFTSGALIGQMTDITGYVNVGGIGQFTVTALTEAPANNDTGIII